MLRSLETRWKSEGKTDRQIQRLRWWHKNKEKIQGQRRSLNLDKSVKPDVRS